MEGMSHHWPFPLVLSLVEGSVARRRVRPRPVFSLQQPMQAHCYRGRCARLPAGTGNLLRWLVNNLAALNTYAVLNLNGVIRKVHVTMSCLVRSIFTAAFYG